MKRAMVRLDILNLELDKILVMNIFYAEGIKIKLLTLCQQNKI